MVTSKTVVPYGFGVNAPKRLTKIFRDFEIPFIVDQDASKWGKTYNGVEVVGPENLRSLPQETKILVTISRRRYDEISHYLVGFGLQEGVDFCHLGQFAQEWYYRYRCECNLFNLHVALTTVCTLKCRYCNMFIPYHKKPFFATLDAFRHDLDLLMNNVDAIFILDFIGGEALLNKDVLVGALSYVVDKYGDRVGNINVTTNAAHDVDVNLLQKIASYGANLVISDYSEGLGSRVCPDELKAVADKIGLTCGITRNPIWTDFGFPERPWNVSGIKAREHMMACDSGWYGLSDGKLYFCNVAWSAEKAGLFKLSEGDCLELALLSKGVEGKRAVLSYSMGNFSHGGAFSFCSVCGGCGDDNKNFVMPAAEQNGGKY